MISEIFGCEPTEIVVKAQNQRAVRGAFVLTRIRLLITGYPRWTEHHLAVALVIELGQEADVTTIGGEVVFHRRSAQHWDGQLKEFLHIAICALVQQRRVLVRVRKMDEAAVQRPEERTSHGL